MGEDIKKATLGGGCFWCIEAVYEEVDGVLSVRSGYSGGEEENPTYALVSSGKSDHAEVVQIEYDSSKISYEEILDIFWNIHNPTTLNRQGNDIGVQYRSVIFYHDLLQKEIALNSKKEASKKFRDEIVTQIVPLETFYEAEGYHQDYFSKNPNQGYCQLVIAPKVDKFRDGHRDKLKKGQK